MQFEELIAHYVGVRESLATSPVPMIPPHLIAFDGDEVLASVTAPRPTPTNVSGLLAIVPMLRPPRIFMVLEVAVRSVTSDTPIAEDPSAYPALVMFHVERGGPASTQVLPFQVQDDGTVKWVSLDFLNEPQIIKTMLPAIRLMEEAQVTDRVKEVVNWFALNNYDIRINPKLLGDD